MRNANILKYYNEIFFSPIVLFEGCITQKKRTRFGDFKNPSGIFRDFHGFLGIFEGFQIKKIPEKNQQLHKNFTFTLVLYHY